MLDDTWANKRSSPDTSENFQIKIKEFKKKAKTPKTNKIQTVKHTITIINNPHKGLSQFKNLSKNNNGEIYGKNSFNERMERMDDRINYNNKNFNISYQNNEDDSIYTDDVPATTEYINKLHINSVKTNNLRELNENYINNLYNTGYTKDSNFYFNPNNFYGVSEKNEKFEKSENFENCEESNQFDSFYQKDLINKNNLMTSLDRPAGQNQNLQNLQNINYNPSSTRFSTNESNESSDSGNLNLNKNFNFTKLKNLTEEKYSYTPTLTRVNNNPNSTIIQYPQAKKLNFNNTGSNNNLNNFNSNQNLYSQSSFNNNFTPNNFNLNAKNNFNNVNNQIGSNSQNGNFSNNKYNTNLNLNNLKINFQNLPENAFSFNTENLNNIISNPNGQNGNGNNNLIGHNNQNFNNNISNSNNSFGLNSTNKNNQEKKKSKKSKDEVDQTLFIINTDNIIYGRDKRTTVMIRHIPNKYSTSSLLEEININFRGKYDFFYLPMDFEVCFNFILKIKKLNLF